MRRAGDRRMSGAALGATLSRIGASYWFVPAILTSLAFGLALASVAVDRGRGGTFAAEIPFGASLAAEDARTLLSIVAQSIFGVTGVMFSMTILAVSFATGKYGPRLIGNFMRDRVNQWSLGILTATFVYALVVTRSVRTGDGETSAFVPHLSILVALVLTLASIAVVIYFVHHIPETIDISRLIAAIGRRLLADIRELAEAQAEAAGPGFEPPDAPPDAALAIERSGYVEALDLGRLRGLAAERGLRIAVDLPLGAFASTESIALRIWGSAPDEETAARLLDCFALGDTPTADKNLRHLLDQLVEVTARALSPGVSDPFTAISCVNWMYAASVAAGTHEGGLTGAQAGPVHLPPMRFADVLEAGFGASRPYTRSDPLCDRHVRDTLDRLARDLDDGPHREALRRFADALDAEADA